MNILPPFFLREQITEGIRKLLRDSVLGTRGAQYQHLDTEQILENLDRPLFLSLERKDRVLANITFCRRQDAWYIRYFAFSKHLQSQKHFKISERSNSLFKAQLSRFFEEQLQREVSCFYAYIEPHNLRSLRMCEQFQFRRLGTVQTQSFSRISPKKDAGFELLDDPEEINSLITQQKDRLFFFNAKNTLSRHAVIRNDQGSIVAFMRYYVAHWNIVRLPGKWGKLKVRAIPYIPVLSSLFKPKKHEFLTPEAVFVKDNDPSILQKLFESALALEQKKLLLWWFDQREELYHRANDQLRWGPLNRFIGTPEVGVLVKCRDNNQVPGQAQMLYVSALDLI
ncbi:MAG: hypothetical protein EP338_00660 [Bacteroidetes bacterium]|nr:MAG: hypothetical protein EP338_00660 [Bacteroidota bacterium]